MAVSISADSAVKDAHVGPAEQKKARMHNGSGTEIKREKGKEIKAKRERTKKGR